MRWRCKQTKKYQLTLLATNAKKVFNIIYSPIYLALIFFPETLVNTKDRGPRKLPTNFLSVFDHFVGLTLKVLTFHIASVHWRCYHFFSIRTLFLQRTEWSCIQKILPDKIWTVMKNLQEEQESTLPVFHLFETCLLFWKLVFLFERVAKKYVCGSYFILNLSKQASNWEGKKFLLILFHKLNLFKILRLHLQSVASVYLPEKNKCVQRKPHPFHPTPVLFTLNCKWNWSREW